MKRVVCFGSAVIDITVKSQDFRVMKSHQVSGGVALCEVYGGKAEVEKINVAVGGAGTNVAVGLSRLGLVSSTVVRVGRDLFGELAVDSLKKEGVDVSNVQFSEDGETAKSVILVAPDGGRSILTARGVSSEIDQNEIDWQRLASVDWIQISSLGGNVDLAENIISWASEMGIPVGWNPGKQELAQRDRLVKLLPKIRLLILNKMEAESLKARAEVTAITDGKNGAVIESNGRRIRADAYKVKSLDDTGAGDAFCTGLVAGYLKELTMEESLKWGLANGASEVTKLGVKDGLLYEKEVARWMKKKTKIVEEKL